MDIPEPLRISLQPAQSRAYLSTATEILYGGAAGGGKSHCLRAMAVSWARMIPGLHVGLFRRLHRDIKPNHIDGPNGFRAMLGPLIATGHVRIVKDEIRFLNNGSKITLNHCQYEKDLDRHQGAEFHVLLFDELTHFTEKQYRFLRSRLRMTGLNLPPHLQGLFPRIVSGANPGGIGHVWVKNTFVSAGPHVIWKAPAKDGGLLRQYIPAKLSDNHALQASDPEYESRLLGLGDPILVRAMLDGDWSVAAGAMFGLTWRDHIHTCNPFLIPIEWPVWRGADDGYVADASVLWFTQNPTTKTVYVIAELTKNQMLPQVMAQRIAAIDRAIPRWIGHTGQSVPNTAQITGLMDPSAFSEKGLSALPRGHQINKELANLGAGKFRKAATWDGSRIHGCQDLHRRLGRNPMDPHHGPGLVIFRNCRKLIETVPALPRDKNNPEDVDTDAYDHPYDALRYGLQWGGNFSGAVKVSGL